MKPYQILKANSEGEHRNSLAILAAPVEWNRQFAELFLVGSRFQASASGNIIFGHLHDGIQRGLIIIHASIALKASSGKHEGATYLNWFIPVERRGEGVYVELEKIWVPPAGALPSVRHFQSGKYVLDVQVGEECFTSAPEVKDDGKRMADANILCQFLVGEITLDDLRTAATEAVRLQSLDEKYQKLLVQYRDLQIKLADTTSLSDELKYARDLLTASDNAVNGLAKDLEAVNTRLARLHDLTKTWWSALWNIGAIRTGLQTDQEVCQ